MLQDAADVTAVLAGVGERLRRLRESRRLTQAELARRAGVSTPTVSNLERGHNASLRVVFQLLEALGRLEEAEQWVRVRPRSLDDVVPRGGER